MFSILSIPTTDKLKCVQCNNYLSYFPVFLTEQANNVCGRCCLPDGKICVHNVAFEEIAQSIKFSCRYKEQGCSEELFPKDIPSHETECHFKVIKCPVKEFIGCDWQGAHNCLMSHCRDTHEDMFLKGNTFELSLNVSNRFGKLTEHDEKLFVALINHNHLSNTLSLMIYHIEDGITDSENYPYRVSLSRNEISVAVERVTTSFAAKNTCEIALDSLTKNNDDKSPIVGKIAFHKSADTRNELNELLLSSSYDLTLHQHPIIDQSNLIKIARMLDYPCRYKENGCKVILKSEEIRGHLSNCPFRVEYCRFCGDWSDGFLKKEFENHVLQMHRNLIMENGATVSVDDKCVFLRRVIRGHGRLFQLLFAINEFLVFEKKYYKWSVNILSNVEEKFRYEIEIAHAQYDNVWLLMQQTCSPADVENEFCVLEDVSQLLSLEEKITFKVNIFKI